MALAVREPLGDDELYMAGTTAPPFLALLRLAQRAVSTAGGGQVDWAGLPATDLDATALIIRQAWLGNTISTDSKCPDPDCPERIDVSFRIADYVEHHQPRRRRGITGPDDEGWFTLAVPARPHGPAEAPGPAVRFRIPTVADLLAAQSAGRSAADVLSARCVEAPGISQRLAKRLDRALSTVAPSLNDLVGGTCPACGQQVTLRFDPASYVLADLRQAFSGIHADVHAIAATYGWSEQAILALPRLRRRQYVALIAAQRAVA
jgi:hypothetical protein